MLGTRLVLPPWLESMRSDLENFASCKPPKNTIEEPIIMLMIMMVSLNLVGSRKVIEQ